MGRYRKMVLCAVVVSVLFFLAERFIPAAGRYLGEPLLLAFLYGSGIFLIFAGTEPVTPISGDRRGSRSGREYILLGNGELSAEVFDKVKYRDYTLVSSEKGTKYYASPDGKLVCTRVAAAGGEGEVGETWLSLWLFSYCWGMAWVALWFLAAQAAGGRFHWQNLVFVVERNLEKLAAGNGREVIAGNLQDFWGRLAALAETLGQRFF